ncbi:MAG TPA: tRNA uridine-5-carboxymethylaminomethyl(34) synthesis GTPase MnmE [Acetobacteraceae bacterium]|nr:tRNA uridine-5-carboxymethylaminomethyl(34) synthesis GTPase MnmE [Acetobacteraceae bacterium]
MDADTIFAVASGAGQAAIAVMRLSGPASRAMLAALCGRLPTPRRASFRRLRDAEGAELDQGMVVWLPGPGSYTGEDAAELYLHGGRAVLMGVADALVALGARPAEPGEFTRRAFLNGRMDLTEAEAVHDLVAAETEAQRRQALRQLDGALGTLYGGWADRLRLLLAQQEALIDFPDEDLPPQVEALVVGELDALRGEVAAHLNDGRRGERLREGLVFAVTGRPNVGKSSLVNALAERDVAIVSAIAGTTRDALETRVVLGGVPVTLVDTAGLRDAENEIEAEGVRRARARAAAADLVISVSEAGTPAEDGNVLVANKIDLGGAVPAGAIGVSALTGEGLDTLRARLAEAARSLTESAGPPPLTQARHRAALLEAAARLAGAQTAELSELRAEDLRLALRALGRITGNVGVEDILNTLFARFCIGK